MRRVSAIVTAALVGLAAPAAGAQPSFQGLGTAGGATSNASAISDDGAAVAGTIEEIGGDDVAFRWTAQGGMQRLPHLPNGFQSFAQGVSADGSVVVGVDFGAVWEGARWDGDAVSALPPREGASTSYGQDVSADGSIVVGFTGEWAFRWSGSGGQALFTIPSFARSVSADGAVVVGEMASGGPFLPYRWTEGGVTMIPVLPGSGTHTAQGVSGDGSVVVGGSASQAYRWTQAGGTVGLSFLPGATTSSAGDVSADGSVVVGTSGGRAFIWTEETGMQSLQDSLVALGLDLAGWTLRNATGISSDGTVIAGFGTHDGSTEAFRAVLPSQCEEPLDIRLWVDPTGGPFADPANWSGNTVPGTADRALFQLADGVDYIVSFAAGHTNDGALLRGGNHVRFDLGGHLYRLTADAGCGSALDVRDGFQTPRLSLTNGLVTAQGSTEVSGPSGTELHVGGGALLHAEGGLQLGGEPGLVGDLVVEAGGALIAAGEVVVGGSGASRLTVEGGGDASLGGTVRVGASAGGVGRVRVAGADALLDVPGTASIGHAGTGILDAEDHGRVVTGALSLGRLAGGHGQIAISGDGRISTRELAIGVDGVGSVDVGAPGELLIDLGLSIPDGPGNGSLFVSGLGAFVSAGVIRVGNAGPGLIRVYAGGLVAAGQLLSGPQANVAAPGGCLRIGGVEECFPTLTAGAGGAIVADTVWISPGATFDSTAVALGPGGVLGGVGTLALDLTNAGTINPGDSAGIAGTFTIGGAYTQAPAGALEIELGGTAEGAYDRLTITGAATLEGTLRFSHIGGFTPAPGDAFDVLTAGSVAGAFATVEGPPGGTYSLAYGPTTVTATVLTVDDEPPAGAARLVLHAPAPNPATGRAAIRYELPSAGRVRLTVYDALGREVAILVDGERPAGAHVAMMDASELPVGAYLVRLMATSGTRTRRLTVAG